LPKGAARRGEFDFATRSLHGIKPSTARCFGEPRPEWTNPTTKLPRSRPS
jgi:hypothetical protein